LRWRDYSDWTSLHEWLFVGEVDEVSGQPTSWFSNRLVLTDQSFVDGEKLDKVEVSRSFRGRDLREAVLNRADLRKADFTGAMLNSASLNGAKLQHVRFGCAPWKEASWNPKEWGYYEVPRPPNWPENGCTWLIGAAAPFPAAFTLTPAPLPSGRGGLAPRGRRKTQL
jgi:hypothetical protein